MNLQLTWAQVTFSQAFPKPRALNPAAVVLVHRFVTSQCGQLMHEQGQEYIRTIGCRVRTGDSYPLKPHHLLLQVNLRSNDPGWGYGGMGIKDVVGKRYSSTFLQRACTGTQLAIITVHESTSKDH
jgi:hypothetical protein